jgi:hypothetical protein
MAAPTQTSPIEDLFKHSWRAGIILFTKRQDHSILEDGFQTASAMCSPDNELIQMTLRANRILLYRIIERDTPKPTDFKDLEELGNDLAKLIQLSQPSK